MENGEVYREAFLSADDADFHRLKLKTKKGGTTNGHEFTRIKRLRRLKKLHHEGVEGYEERRRYLTSDFADLHGLK